MVGRKRGRAGIVSAGRWLIGVAGTAAVLAACSTVGGPAATNSMTPSTQSSPSATPSPTQSAEDKASAAALEAYTGYWTASNAASRAPGKQDWRPELAKYTADPALAQRLDSLANFAAVPAHFEGEPKRAPRVDSVSLQQPPRVTISDCLDVSGWKLLSDRPGEEGKNLNDPKQPQRYRFSAQVVLYGDPDRWLVQIVQPEVGKAC